MNKKECYYWFNQVNKKKYRKYVCSKQKTIIIIIKDAAVAHEKGKTQPNPAWMTKLANKNK